MGSVVLDHPRSDDQSINMLGGTITPAESGYRPASHHAASHPPPAAPFEAASSRSTPSNTNTPTSSTAPPSASSAGSARASSALPPQPQDVPPYINRLPLTTTPQSSSRPSSATPASSRAHPLSASMSASASTGHGPRADYQSQPYPSRSAHQTPSRLQTGSQSSPASPRLRPTSDALRSLGGSEANSPSRIRVRDLSHIQSFASEEFLAQSQSRMPGPGTQGRQFEISSMPVTDIIEMVAGLLTKITTTNDLHHEQVQRHIPPPDGTGLTPQASSVLAFHGKNVPSISILSYLTRIHRYCPTTYEVFLSLLVYFDRMTELVNKGQLDRLRQHWEYPAPAQNDPPSSRSSHTVGHSAQPSPIVTPPSSATMTAQQDPNTPAISPSLNPQAEDQFAHCFVVDSFNIHRLVIAGVTCASKFFSDVFYTNSRYAKVGGLPLVELNHLELQFLLLNDFRLSIPVEELEAYGTMLVEFYAREIVEQQQQSQQDPYSEGLAMETDGKSHYASEVRQTPTPP